LIAVHVLVDTCDAMGANLVNSICEAIGPDIATACEGHVALRIVSNLADRSLYTARVRYELPDNVRDAIVTANNIALVDHSYGERLARDRSRGARLCGLVGQVPVIDALVRCR
jgi:hydroxymethylglutaryl-CoA reductase